MLIPNIAYEATVTTTINMVVDEKSHYIYLIEKYAQEYKVSSYKMKRTIWCESQYKNVQSNVIKNGVREESYGLVQIHLPSHPHITKEQALNPEFAIKFMAREFALGNSWKWYGYDTMSDTCSWAY